MRDSTPSASPVLAPVGAGGGAGGGTSSATITRHSTPPRVGAGGDGGGHDGRTSSPVEGGFGSSVDRSASAAAWLDVVAAIASDAPPDAWHPGRAFGGPLMAVRPGPATVFEWRLCRLWMDDDALPRVLARCGTL